MNLRASSIKINLLSKQIEHFEHLANKNVGEGMKKSYLKIADLIRKRMLKEIENGRVL